MGPVLTDALQVLALVQRRQPTPGRPVEPERLDQMISGIVRRLESMGETDIPSKAIGEIVMEALARIDTVGYVRFASVYKNFQAADDFEDFVSELRPPTPES